ncbi:MAG TPA: hypothetical protein VI548_01025 [Chitinophagaceae bacterium]|nr:hypothetical protein [Chitinophagaceae bacterium]
MQKFLLFILLTVLGSNLFAQSLDDIKEQINKGQWEKAKTTVDAYLTKDKNAAKWEGWWYKGVIYNEIAKNEELKKLVPDGRMEAFNAFKKYYEIDPKMLQATLEQNVRLFDIYSGYFDLAAADFNDKKYEDAFNNFKNALQVEEYIYSKNFEYNNFKFPEFDTTLIQNIALSAYFAKKQDEAVKYYTMIADRKIAGEDKADVYQFLVEHYHNKKDMANREKYLQLGRELFPKDDFWYQTELSDAPEGNLPALLAKYEELIPKYPDKFVLPYNYSVEIYNHIYIGDKPADYKEMQAKLEATIKKTLAINKDYPDANILMARHYYNLIYDLQDEQRAIKGNTPADQAKRNTIKATLQTKVDEMIPYAMVAYNYYESKTTLKASEKGNFKIITDLLVSAYEIKGDKEKTDFYKKKLESLRD